jgi:N-acetylglucosaminyldiphosphoundecaprenol N-acetyl-beta-D-mannosaminyltransferase
MNNRKSVVSIDVNITNIIETLQQVEFLAKREIGAYVCVSNVHMCMEAFDSVEFQKVVNNADLVIPDGKPLSIALKLLGQKKAKQVRGQDIMNEICKSSGRKQLNIGFYGGSSNALLDEVKRKLIHAYPDINITYSFSPPFRPLNEDENNHVINEINASAVNVLFVGIGCPKQERWMAEHKDSLNCVMLGVGAAYDFIAGSKKHAPRWLQTLGLEWLFRLVSEPKRLWKRYLKQNPRFIYYFAKQLIKHKLSGDKPTSIEKNV